MGTKLLIHTIIHRIMCYNNNNKLCMETRHIVGLSGCHSLLATFFSFFFLTILHVIFCLLLRAWLRILLYDTNNENKEIFCLVDGRKYKNVIWKARSFAGTHLLTFNVIFLLRIQRDSSNTSSLCSHDIPAECTIPTIP